MTLLEPDVPAEWCAAPASLAPVSMPGWMKPLEVPSSRPAPGVPSQSEHPSGAREEPAREQPPLPPLSIRAPSLRPSIKPSLRPVLQAGPTQAEVEQLHAALIEAVAVGVRARREALVAAERDLVHLALAIAGKVIGKELATDPSIVAGWAREGIAALAEQDQVVVAISADIAERLPPEAWRRALDGVEPIVDRALPPGGCEVRGAYGRVDAGLAPRLAAVAEVLEDALPGAVGDLL